VCQLLPTDSFDPSVEEVLRFAGVLGRVHRVSRSIGGMEARSVRIRLGSVDGLLAYSVEGPARTTSLLRNPGFAQVEARPVGQPASGGVTNPSQSMADTAGDEVGEDGAWDEEDGDVGEASEAAVADGLVGEWRP
jgi:hypothetical protein